MWQFYAYLYSIYDQGWLEPNQVDLVVGKWRKEKCIRKEHTGI